MNPDGTLILKRSEVASLLNLGECIGAVEEAFRLNEEGQSLPPGVLETLTGDGGFHIKAAGLRLADRTFYAAKVNANFPQNMGRRGAAHDPGRRRALRRGERLPACPAGLDRDHGPAHRGGNRGRREVPRQT